MSDARIHRAFPGLTEPLALTALLGETLDMARDLKLTHGEISTAGANPNHVQDLLQQAGLVAEIEAAEQTAQQTVVEILVKVSEQDLQEGRDRGLLSPEDYADALRIKRTLSLAQGRHVTPEREQEHEP